MRITPRSALLCWRWLLLAFGAVVWLGSGELNAQKAHYHIYFSGPVSGLREGAVVEYNGVPVGKVEQIRIDPEDVALIQTTIAIDPTLVVRKDAVATLQSNLLSGVSFVQIRGGTQDAPPLEARGKQRYPVIPSVPSTLASVAESGPELLKKLNDTVDRFGLLLDEKNRQALGESLENLRVFTAGLAQRNDDIAELAGNAKSATAEASKLLAGIERSYNGPDGIEPASAPPSPISTRSPATSEIPTSSCKSHCATSSPGCAASASGR